MPWIRTGIANLLRPVEGTCATQRQRELELNAAIEGYPGNHTYRVSNGKLVASKDLSRRYRQIEKLLPQPIGKLLDVGCSKGFFVLAASAREGCEFALGIDVHAPAIETATAVRDHVGRTNVRFEVQSLELVARRVEEFGGPFDVVTLLNTYHYLYWGSQLYSEGCRNHSILLERLARVCSGTLIFSSPLEVQESPQSVRELAQREAVVGYTTADFLQASQEFFEVRQEKHWGKRPVYVMTRRR